MTSPGATTTLRLASPPEHVFPRLTPAQMDRVAAHGQRRRVRSGEVLLEIGESGRIFVITAGSVETVRVVADLEEIIVTHGIGSFTGEVAVLSGRRGLARNRAREAGEVIEVDRSQLMALVQTDSELSDIFMRAFILRRLAVIARGSADVVLLGSRHSAGTLRIQEFLTRNAQPMTYVDLEQDADVQYLLERFQVRASDMPIVIFEGRTVLHNPTNERIAECVGLNAPVDPAQVRDVVVVGAGPAGLAAAVYGASEGLDVLVVESRAPGGQAGSSSRIENYLGFPTGISGQDLADRAYSQAQKFGAQVLVAKKARALRCRRGPFAVELDDGSSISARTIVLATGASYRKLAIPDLARFEGVGVYYGATAMEAQLCRGEDVVVVGGGNSAGQAAVFLAQSALRVYILVRGAGLAETMSNYLIRRIEQSPSIELRTRMEIVGLQGGHRLEAVCWRNNQTMAVERRAFGHVFVMTGAEPATRWLADCVVLDDKGFVKTGTDLTRDELTAAGWPPSRAPRHLETSRPGVFAVGDVRSGNQKRVASAVGEGSTAIALVHQALKGMREPDVSRSGSMDGHLQQREA
ncbi:MAG TPA: FAD-dependent oxidoreductase [Vicinamibacteria bacterium]|nr:FAD-dependent oxidoreductase [Vicinamibacteria bacterium]